MREIFWRLVRFGEFGVSVCLTALLVVLCFAVPLTFCVEPSAESQMASNESKEDLDPAEKLHHEHRKKAEEAIHWVANLLAPTKQTTPTTDESKESLASTEEPTDAGEDPSGETHPVHRLATTLTDLLSR
ncbi:hypothetical protein Pan216_44530 [Planctomycetes bacterium Pan216]|uniref:Uncharacterized protein n=1 Tax=Kolteria novifilia TaxID=2527975 RepID=A0A518B9C7_9BACT|nr:hypothetical protein Pan216_44530 [Planctomycetes bacterium Pan216]